MVKMVDVPVHGEIRRDTGADRFSIHHEWIAADAVAKRLRSPAGTVSLGGVDPVTMSEAVHDLLRGASRPPELGGGCFGGCRGD